jgi:predicted 3-demethylubiquinone-9 3-methyltransferase (glyoxalase superfamily)
MKICLWFDKQAEEAVKFYSTVFDKTEIGTVLRYGKEGSEIHGMPDGTAMSVEFTINDMEFIGINGGPLFKFNEAVSIMVVCNDQQEIDTYWNKLTKEGQELPCGWCKDKYGVVWQITPAVLHKMLSDTDQEKVQKVTQAFMQMKKFDIAKLEQAFADN